MSEDQVKIKKEPSSLGVTCCSDGDHYPYDTSLSIDDDLITDLNADALAVGDVVEIRGYAFVDNKSEHSDQNNSNKSLRLQMTSMKLARENDDRVKQLYGS